MRVASRVGAIAVAALLLLAAAPAAQAEDAPAPVVYLLSWPTEFTNHPNAVFTFTSTATGFPPDSITCQLDGAASFDCSTGHVSLNGLAEGAHSFVITPADSRGAGESVTVPWTIDLTAPDTSASATAWTNYFGAGVTMSSSDTDVSYFECAVGSGAFSPCSFRYPEGLVTLRVRTVDRAGNADPTPAEVTFTVENAPPETFATLTPNSADYIDIHFGSTDSDSGVASVSCHIYLKTFEAGLPVSTYIQRDDATSCAGYSRPWSIEGDTEVVIWATATDVAGNVDPTPAEASWIRDTTPPVLTIESGPAALTSATSASFVLSAVDAHDHLQGSGFSYYLCALAGQPMQECGANVEFTDLPEGEHTFFASAIDKQGNTTDVEFWTWTVDTTPPLTEFTTGPPAFDSHDSGQLEWVVTGGPATSVCSLDGGPEASCSSPVAYADLAEGFHYFTVRSTDEAGNAEGYGATHEWIVDTIVPTMSFLTTPDAITSNPVARFYVSAGGDWSKLECILDSVVVTCALDYTVADGTHTYSIVGIDVAGNRSAPTSFDWTVDTIAPHTVFTATPGAVSDASVTFEFAADAPDTARIALAAAVADVVFECSLDGDDFESCASRVTVSGLGDGLHIFAVRATDAAGNVESSPATYSWLVNAPVAAVVPAAVLAATGLVPLPAAAASAALLVVGGVLLFSRRRHTLSAG